MRILSLDLSTSVTGWAVFEKGKLVKTGMLVPKIKGITKMGKLEKAYRKIVCMSNLVRDVVAEVEPDHIVVEEINRGMNRLGQKVLDSLHYFVVDKLVMLDDDWLNQISYIDTSEWRGILKVKLDDSDKAWNKKAREYNKLNKTGIKNKTKVKKDVIDWKALAVRYVNKHFKQTLDVKVKGDNDIADAICVAAAFLKKG